MAYFGRSLLCDLFKFLTVKDTAMNACKVFLRMKRTPQSWMLYSVEIWIPYAMARLVVLRSTSLRRGGDADGVN